MTDRDVLEAVYAQIGAQLQPPPVPVTSPTGREPKLLWTSTLQTTYNRMKADGHVWAGLIIANANGNRYGDNGLWATLAYQMTGDVAFVPKAWAKLQPFLTATTFSDNDVREESLERVLLLDWLWPSLTPAQRDQCFAQLDLMFTDAFTNAFLPASFPLRKDDSDQVTGVYMGVAAYAAAFGDVHPPALDFFTRPFIGGYDSTARDRTTLRNCVRDYVEMAAGGEWIESAQYNLGTVRLLVLGAEAIRAATGIDHFPDVTDWKIQAANRYRHMLTPDLKQSFQWGDDQDPHLLVPRLFAHVTTAMLFDDPDARDLVNDLVLQYGATGTNSAEPWARGFLQFDPYGPMEASQALIFNASGQGLVSARDGFSPTASQLMAHCPPTHPNGSVDHAVGYLGDVQLYRKGAWALTHPITYGGPSVINGDGINSMRHCGFGAPLEYRLTRPVESGPGWVQVSGTCGGSVLAATANYWKIPTFWYEFSRLILWQQGMVDTLIVFDRSHVVDPRTLPQFSHYSTAVQAQITANPLRDWRWHCPVVPTVNGNTAEWPIASGVARVTWSRPDLVPLVVNQQEAWPSTSIVASEKKYHLTLTPPNVPGFQTCVTVLQFGDPALFGTVTIPSFNTTPGPVLPSPITNAYDQAVPGLLAGIVLRGV